MKTRQEIIHETILKTEKSTFIACLEVLKASKSLEQGISSVERLRDRLDQMRSERQPNETI